MLKQFPPPRDYSALSLSDLLAARDQYHDQLSHLSNVVGTAVGRYLIHKDDWHATHPPELRAPKGFKKPRGPHTLFNTVVRDWSWPCVLVFVNSWLELHEFSESPDQMVPRALFIRRGRTVVPTCVIYVQPTLSQPPGLDTLSFPKSYIGGGYLVSTAVQGREHLGSIGCLMSDGDLTYALQIDM